MTVTERHAFVTEHSSVVRIAEQSERVQKAAKVVIEAVIKHNGLEWLDGHGGEDGYFPGLEEKLLERFQRGSVQRRVGRPRCSDGCTLEFDVRILDDLLQMEVWVRCAAKSFSTRAQAEAQYEQCKLVHEDVPAYVDAELRALEHNIEHCEAMVKKAELELAQCKKKLADYV